MSAYNLRAEGRVIGTYADVETTYDAIHDYAAQCGLDIIMIEADADHPGCLDAFIAKGFTAIVLSSDPVRI
jgi:hypothetical protein